MGCDAYASEEGRLVIEIRSYEDNRRLQWIEIENLKPRERIAVEYMEGEER